MKKSDVKIAQDNFLLCNYLQLLQFLDCKGLGNVVSKLGETLFSLDGDPYWKEIGPDYFRKQDEIRNKVDEKFLAQAQAFVRETREIDVNVLPFWLNNALLFLNFFSNDEKLLDYVLEFFAQNAEHFDVTDFDTILQFLVEREQTQKLIGFLKALEIPVVLQRKDILFFYEMKYGCGITPSDMDPRTMLN